MRRVALIALAVAAPQPLLASTDDEDRRPHLVASLPCVASFSAMAWHPPVTRPRPDRVDRVAPPPPPRRDLPRRLPCLRLTSA